VSGRPVICWRPEKKEDGRRSRQWRRNPEQRPNPAPASLDDLDFMCDWPIDERCGNRCDRAATIRTRCQVRQRTTPAFDIEGAVGQGRHRVFIQAVRRRYGSFARVEVTA
jgi:hypothetical protein